MFKNFHFWHIVNISPWPLLLSFNIFALPIGLVVFLQGYYYGLLIFFFFLIFVIFCMFTWFKDIISEASCEGMHTKNVQKSLIIGMLWFIFSEVLFFIAFFWSFFWSCITPTIVLNVSWPPIGMGDLVFEPWDIPLINTLILLLSGVTVTLSHLYLKKGNRVDTGFYMLCTICLAEFFLIFQIFEYVSAPFDISDGIYGSTFFMCTGFHGFHVMIGTIFLSVIFFRISDAHFSRMHHFGFEAAAWYWHFVDVVWLFLFTMVYYWGWDLVSSTIYFILDEELGFFFISLRNL